jgi:protein ImuB
MIVCALLPRFALATAIGDRSELLQTPAALAPEPGGVQTVGEVSPAAEALGVHPGLRLGEALARCPELTLVPPDPAGVADRWERLLVRLESMGAAVEPERPGLACFDARGLLRLHGGLEGVLAEARRALRVPARFGAAPSRFAAVAAATRARSRRPEIVGRAGVAQIGGRVRDANRFSEDGRALARAYLAPLPVALLRARPALAELPEALQRLGVRTLGELAAMPAAALPIASGHSGCSLTSWPAGGTARSVRGRPENFFVRRSICPRRHRESSWSGG